MAKAISFYVIIELGFLILAVISLVFWDRRYRRNHGSSIPAGFEKTEEVTLDPKNGKRFRVYYNASTGERFYHQEDIGG